jgi:hypothetical protein
MLRASIQHAEYLIWELSEILTNIPLGTIAEKNQFIRELRGY